METLNNINWNSILLKYLIESQPEVNLKYDYLLTKERIIELAHDISTLTEDEWVALYLSKYARQLLDRYRLQNQLIKKVQWDEERSYGYLDLAASGDMPIDQRIVDKQNTFSIHFQPIGNSWEKWEITIRLSEPGSFIKKLGTSAIQLLDSRNRLWLTGEFEDGVISYSWKYEGPPENNPTKDIANTKWYILPL
jgi:hypothetical protein